MILIHCCSLVIFVMRPDSYGVVTIMKFYITIFLDVEPIAASPVETRQVEKT